MDWFAALDGGGTKTRCWIADGERVLGRAQGGTVKLMRVDAETAEARLRALLEEAAVEAGVELAAVKRTCFGLAGSSSASVREWAEATLGRVVGGDIEVCGDEEIALDAAFHGGPGVLVIAGTGSNVVGRCTDGGLHSAGGWGPVIGDEGSAHWIGMEAVKAGLRAHDRGVETCLLREIEAQWGMHDLGALVAHANAQTRPDFAALAELVARCADGGDALAASVLERAGHELAEQVSLVASKMHAAGCAAGDAQRVAYTGSVLEKNSRVRRTMEEALHVSLPKVVVQQTAVEPLEGALWRARRKG
jgi:N-acetylglucosamine kinase-like BadF-type ATPase